MTTSELITPHHLQQQAIIYIRQSSPHQVVSHQESLRLQYAFQERAVSLGWHPETIRIIDCDLGQSAASADQRVGFKELIALVTLGEVGLILSYDVTRLARNCSDWYPLLDLCGYKQCLIGDRDGVYDPGSTNGRLLLGLKGQLSELELHTLRARLTAGLLNTRAALGTSAGKAQRGELALRLPIGLVREANGRVVKDPNREVQDRLALVFATFLERRSASQVLQDFNQHQLRLPRHDRLGEVIWKCPTIAAVLAILKNPAYAGAFVYGRTRTLAAGPGRSDKHTLRLPMDQWKIHVPNVYPAYLPWETFERIQAMLQDNYAEYDRNKSRGIPRPGAALLHGIVYCGECGHKMVVQYKGGTRYICNYLRQQYHVPVCQYLSGDVIDQVAVEAFFQALAPIELDAYARAVAADQARSKRLGHVQRQQLERLRYVADLAQRQFAHVDPENRLVAAELEQRWEDALAALQQAEALERQKSQTLPIVALPADLQARFRNIGQALPQLWRDGLIPTPHQKALLRCLIDKVVIHRVTPDQVQIRLVWKGGETTTRIAPLPVKALARLTNAAALEQLILKQAAQGVADETIAQELTSQGFRSPMGAMVLPSTVKIIRLRHGIFQTRSQSHPRRITGYLTVPQLAQTLGLTAHWIYDRIHNGTIAMTKDPIRHLFLFPDTPATVAGIAALKNRTLKKLRY